MSRISRVPLFRMAALVLAVVLFPWRGGAFAAEEQGYLLRYKFTPQQTLHFVTQNDSVYLVEYGQAKETVKHTSMSLREMTVLNVGSDGVAEVQLMISRAHMSAENAGVDSVYDSDSPDHVPTEFAGVHQSIRKPLKIRLSPLGTVLPVQGANAPPVQDDLLIQFPEQPVVIGGLWKDKFEVNVQAAIDGKLFRQVKMQRRYELKSVENDIATIEVKTVPLTPISDPFQESQLIQRKHNGVLKFDISRGCLLDRTLRIDERVVGNQGDGSALTVEAVKLDQQLSREQLQTIDLTKPIVPVNVAAESIPLTK